MEEVTTLIRGCILGCSEWKNPRFLKRMKTLFRTNVGDELSQMRFQCHPQASVWRRADRVMQIKK